MRVLSFDVGLRHLAYAEITSAPEGVTSAPEGVTSAPEGGGGRASVGRWGVIDVTKGAKMSPDALTAALVEALDVEFFDPGRVRFDVVLIENQPSRKNPAMKAVQTAMHAYFATVRLHAPEFVGEVRPVSAKQKLSGDAASALQTGDGASYRARKARSVELCRHALAEEVCEDERVKGILRDAKKKDDLSDALLQGLWYLRTLQTTRKGKKGKP